MPEMKDINDNIDELAKFLENGGYEAAIKEVVNNPDMTQEEKITWLEQTKARIKAIEEKALERLNKNK